VKFWWNIIWDGFMELVWEERSLGLERRLCVSEYVTGRSRLEPVWFEPFEKKGGRELGFPLPGWLRVSEASLGRGANGLMKLGDAGVNGLSGVLSGT
jgi:hypothetical protein